MNYDHQLPPMHAKPGATPFKPYRIQPYSDPRTTRASTVEARFLNNHPGNSSKTRARILDQPRPLDCPMQQKCESRTRSCPSPISLLRADFFLTPPAPPLFRIMSSALAFHQILPSHDLSGEAHAHARLYDDPCASSRRAPGAILTGRRGVIVNHVRGEAAAGRDDACQDLDLFLPSLRTIPPPVGVVPARGRRAGARRCDATGGGMVRSEGSMAPEAPAPAPARGRRAGARLKLAPSTRALADLY